jgi:hypothetical protein
MDQQSAAFSTPIRERSGFWSSPWTIASLLFLGALLLRLAGIGERPPKTDELYHLLAARSWAENGTLAIADGQYLRARGYTIATAVMYELFGTSIGAGRLLAALGAAVQVATLGLWVRWVASARAAWIAGLLLLFSHESLLLSQFARFYTWHAAFVLIAAVSAYALVHADPERHRWRAIGLAALALASLHLAMQLQDTTVIMIAALGAWGAVLFVTSPATAWLRSSPRLMIGGAVLLALAGALFAYAARDPLLAKWQSFRQVAEWAKGRSDHQSYYFWLLLETFGWLFAMLPLAVLTAWRSYRRPVLFCVLILLVGLALHSVAGMKAVRYVYYLLPFMFVIWALAVEAAAPVISRFLSGGWEWSGWPAPLQSLIRAGLAVVVVAMAILGVPDLQLGARAAVKALRTGSIEMAEDYPAIGREEYDWRPWLPALRPLTANSILITADENRTLYYLGDYDVLLNRTILWDFTKREFARDPRTGRIGISTGASLARVIACYPSGTILIPEKRWRSADVTDDAADVIERETRRVALPADIVMLAYLWRRPAASLSPDCAALRRLIGTPSDRGGSASIAP